MSNNWYEIWVNESFDPPYLLLVQSCDPALVVVRDPSEKYRIVYEANEYESVKLWLLEDEYIRVGSRNTSEDWWEQK